MTLRRLSPALLAVVALLAAGCANAPGENAAPDEAAQTPAGTIGADTTGAGAPVLARADFDLSEHRGEVVLLNFWATWCAPCRMEMPDLVQLQKDLGGRGLQIVGVSLDRPGREVVVPYVSANPINYPIVIDSKGTLAERYGGVMALPTTLVIGREGEVQGRLIGLLQMEQVRPRLEQMLDGEASSSSS